MGIGSALRRRIKTQSANLFRTCVYIFCSIRSRPIGFLKPSSIMEMEPRSLSAVPWGLRGRAARTDGPQLAACAAKAEPLSSLSPAGQKGYLDGWSNHTPSAPTRAHPRQGAGEQNKSFRLRRFCLLFVTRDLHRAPTPAWLVFAQTKSRALSFSFCSDSYRAIVELD
jgi:hypothetical protein